MTESAHDDLPELGRAMDNFIGGDMPASVETIRMWRGVIDRVLSRQRSRCERCSQFEKALASIVNAKPSEWGKPWAQSICRHVLASASKPEDAP